MAWLSTVSHPCQLDTSRANNVHSQRRLFHCVKRRPSGLLALTEHTCTYLKRWHFETVDKWREGTWFWAMSAKVDCHSPRALWCTVGYKLIKTCAKLSPLFAQTNIHATLTKESFPVTDSVWGKDRVEHGRRKLININVAKKQARRQLIDDWSFHCIRFSLRAPKECIVFKMLICRLAASAPTAAKWEQNRNRWEKASFYD